MRIISLFFFFVIACFANAQTRIFGIVSNDKGETIPYAIVSVEKYINHEIISYAATDDIGYYNINIPSLSDSVLVEAKCLGYIKQKKTVSITDSLQIDFILKEDVVELEEVAVNGRYTGVKYAGDTIKYDVNIFRDGSEHNIGDVLNKLPGIEVEDNGNIKAQGKNVNKLLLNGNDLFNGNTQVAQQINADIVDKVEVLNNYSEYSILKGFQRHEGTAINIKVKNEFLSRLSGDLNLSGGFIDKYKTNGNIMMLKSSFMTSLIGASNNTGDEVLSLMEYLKMQGIFEEIVNSGNNSGIFEISKTMQKLLLPSENIYSRKNHLASLNIISQPSQKLKINTSFIFNTKTEKDIEEELRTYMFSKDDTFFTQDSSSNKKNNNIYNATIKVNGIPNENTSVNYIGMFNHVNLLNDARKILSHRLSTTNINDNNSSASTNTNHSFSFIKKLNKDLILGNVMFSYKESDDCYEMITDSVLLPIVFISSAEGLYHVRQKEKKEDFSTNASISYNHRLNDKYVLSCGTDIHYNNQNLNTNIFDYNLNVTYDEDSLKNRINSKIYNSNINIGFSKNNGLIQYNLKLNGTYLYIKDMPKIFLNNNLFNVNPDIDFSLHLSPKHIISTKITISDIPISQNGFTTGLYFHNFRNYQLKNDISHRFYKKYIFNFSYQLYDLFSNTMINIIGRYSKSKNNLTSDFLSDGITTGIKSISSPKTNDFNGSIYLNKGLNIPWIINIKTNYNNSLTYNKINGINYGLRAETTDAKISFDSKYERLNFGIYSDFEYDKYNFGLTNSINRQRTFGYGGKLKLKIKNIFSEINGEYIQTLYEDVKWERFILNISAEYKYDKHLTFSISGNNILHLKSEEWTKLSFNDIYRSELTFYKIPGNILLSIKYVL